MRLGLKPAPGTEDYFQKIPLVRTRTDKKNTFLKINNNQGENIFLTDSIITLIRPSVSLNYTGKLVFAGYGYTDKDKGYNDLSGVDLKDKIVLMMTGKPDNTVSDNSEFFNDTVEGLKIMSIIGGGAKAILLVYDPAGKFHDAYDSGLAEMISSDAVSLKDQKQFSLPAQITFITQNAANALLKTTGSTLKQMRDKIVSTGKPVSAEVQDIIVTVSTSLEKTEFSGSNVVGIVEGSDPVLKKECIIYTAHFDHTGIGANGEINNGADDDASGSMALMEVAEAFMKLKKKPLRTMVFAWVNGEEKGLLGSNYYAGHPLVPLENTLADINLDMVGRSKMAADTGKLYGFEINVTQPGELIVYTAHESSELLDIMYASAKESGLTVKDMGRDIPAGSSDHVSFREKGIPALCFHSGIHADLHGPGDDTDKIDFDKMEKSSKMAFLIGYKVANQKERIAIDNPDK
jgi:Zn-dependent M28 family amino/carboxypeptidase